MVRGLLGLITFGTLVVACVSFLALLGLPFRWFFFADRPDPFAVETTAAGGAVFGVFAWHWSTFGSGGMQRGMPGLVVVAVVALVAGGVRTRRLRPPGLRRAASAAAPPLVFLLASLGLFAVHFPGFFTQDEVGPVSAGNNDLPFYALNAGHLERHPFDGPSPVVTYELGKEAKTDVAGGFLFLAGMDAVTGVEEWRYSAVALAFGLFLLMGALAHLVRRLGIGAISVQGGIAILAVASGTFFYSMLHGYVAYALTLGPMVLLLAVGLELADTPSWAERRGPLLVGSLTATWVYVVYPHVTFFFVPLLLAMVVAWRLGRSADVGQWLRSTVEAGAAAMAMFVLPVLVIPDRVVISVQRTLALDATTAGWPLGRVRLAQWLGLVHFPDGPTGRAVSVFGGLVHNVVLMAYVVLLVLAAAVVVGVLLRTLRPGRTRAERLTLLVALTLPVALYEVLHLRYGELYQAWKAVTYLQPVVVAGVLVVAWQLLCMAVGDDRRLRALGGALCAGAVAVATIGVAKPHRNVLNLRLTDEHRDLGSLTRRFGMDSLNVELTAGAPVWDGMWAMYFVGGITFHLQSDSYVAKSPPMSSWTLRSPGSAVTPGATRYVLNSRFVLDHSPLPPRR